jgi:hypothetical protein
MHAWEGEPWEGGWADHFDADDVETGVGEGLLELSIDGVDEGLRGGCWREGLGEVIRVI